MDNAVAVRVIQTASGLQGVVHGCSHIERAVLSHQRPQILSFDVFHHQKVDPIRFIRVMRSDDIPVGQFGRSSGFTLKPLDRLR